MLIFGRLIHQYPKEILELLSDTSIDNRISLKIVLDKWLLQQSLFRGYYTKNTTYSALMKLLLMRDTRIESLMVIGYDPSHSNINSEVNAPFKILSIMLRYLDSEYNPKKTRRVPVDNYDENDEEEKQGITPGYKMRRDLMGEGERLDTYEGDDDGGMDYGEEESNKTGVQKIPASLDEVEDDDDNESLLGISNKKEGGSLNQPGLFSVVQSNDKGLADMETGSEVYMSELLVTFPILRV